MSRSGGLLLQGSSGTKGNFEALAPRTGGGYWQFWRDNDTAGFPWHGPGLAMGSEDDVTDVVLVQDNHRPDELASVRREGGQLRCSTRGYVNVHGVVSPRWGASAELPGGGSAGGAPGFAQSMSSNFEVVAPLTTGGLAHWWRDNGVPAQPWHGPDRVAPGTFSSAALIQNDQGNLEVVAVSGVGLVNFWRDAAGVWHGPIAIAGGSVSGQPGFIQANDGTCQVVAPLAAGGMGHWSRDPAGQWSGPIAVGSGSVRAVGLIQGNFGAGNLEVVARLDAGLDHYSAEPAGGAWTWHGPNVAWRHPALDPATDGRCDVGFTPGGPSAIHVSTLADGRPLSAGADHQPAAAPGDALRDRQRGVPVPAAEPLGRGLPALADLPAVDDQVVIVADAVDSHRTERVAGESHADAPYLHRDRTPGPATSPDPSRHPSRRQDRSQAAATVRRRHTVRPAPRREPPAWNRPSGPPATRSRSRSSPARHDAAESALAPFAAMSAHHRGRVIMNNHVTRLGLVGVYGSSWNSSRARE